MSDSFSRALGQHRERLAAQTTADAHLAEERTADLMPEPASALRRRVVVASRDPAGVAPETFLNPGDVEFVQGFLRHMGAAAMPGAVSLPRRLSGWRHGIQGYRIGYVNPLPPAATGRHLPVAAAGYRNPAVNATVTQGADMLAAVRQVPGALQGWRHLETRESPATSVRQDSYPQDFLFTPRALHLPRAQGVYLCEDGQLRTNDNGSFLPDSAVYTPGFRYVAAETITIAAPYEQPAADAPRGPAVQNPSRPDTFSTEWQHWQGIVPLQQLLIATAQVHLPG